MFVDTSIPQSFKAADESIPSSTDLRNNALCSDLVETTRALADILGINIPNTLSDHSQYFETLICSISKLCKPKFKGHTPIPSDQLAPVVESLKTISWLIDIIANPNFPKFLEGPTTCSPDLVLSSAKQFVTEATFAKQATEITERIITYLNAAPPQPEPKKLEVPVGVREYLDDSQIKPLELSDLGVDEDPVGARKNNLEIKAKDSGEFQTQMDCSGDASFGDLRAGRISSRNSKAFNLLGVYEPSVLVGNGGIVCGIFSWIANNMEKYPSLKGFLKQADLTHESALDHNAAIYEYPLKFSKRQNRLPLPPKHEVLSLCFLDSDGNTISSKDNHRATWSVFGGLLAEFPLNAVTARYTVLPIEWDIGQEAIDAFLDASQDVSFYSPPSVRDAIAASSELQKDPEERAQFLFRIVKNQQLIGTHDQHIAKIINCSGTARNEVIAGIGCGNCTPLNYYLTSIFRKAGIPSVLLFGDPILEEGQFLINPGHSQAFAFSSTRGSTLDITNSLVSHLGINPNKLSTEEWEKRLEIIRSGTLRDAFLTASQIRRDIICSPEEAHLNSDRNSPSLSPLHGRDDSRPISFNPQTDLRRDHNIERLAEMYAVKDFVDQFRIIAAKSLHEKDLTELYAFCERTGKFPKIHSYYRNKLPESFISYYEFDADEELNKISVAVLKDISFPAEGKQVTSEWFVRRYNYSTANTSVANQVFLAEGYQTTEDKDRDLQAALGLIKTLPNGCEEEIFKHANQDSVSININRCLNLIFSIAGTYRKETTFANPKERYWCSPGYMADKAALAVSLASIFNSARLDEFNQDTKTLIFLAASCLLCESHHTENNNFYSAEEQNEFSPNYRGLPPAFEESIERIQVSCRKILSIFASSSQQHAFETMVFIAGYGNPNTKECWKWFRDYCTIQEPSLSSLFSWESKGERNQNLLTSTLVNRLEMYLASGYKFHEALPWFTSLGISPNLVRHQDEIRKSILAACNSDNSIKFNVPTPANPNSFALYYLQDSSRSRILESVYGISIYLVGNQLEFTSQVWPETDEAEVGRYLLSNLTLMKYVAGPLCVFEIAGKASKNPLSPGAIPNLLKTFSPDSPVIDLACNILAERVDPEGHVANIVSRLKDSLPEKWIEFTDRIRAAYEKYYKQHSKEIELNLHASAGIAILRTFDKWQIYISILGVNRILSPENLPAVEGEKMWQTHSRALKAMEEQLINSTTRWSQALTMLNSWCDLSLTPDCETRARDFSIHLPSGVWQKSLLAHALIVASQSRREAIDQLVGHRSDLNLSQGFGIAKGGKVESAWISTLIPQWTDGIDLSSIYRKLQSLSKVDFSRGKLYQARFSGMAIKGKSSIQVPVQSGGEFAEFREMKSGDDPRRIDWRTYARTDRYHTRKYVEPQPQEGIIFVDLEWLSDGFGIDRDTDISPPLTLSALFVELYQNIKSGNYPHLVICLRGDLLAYYDDKAIKDIFSKRYLEEKERERHSTNYPHRSDEAFMYNLIWSMRRCARSMETENTWRKAGFYPCNIAKDLTAELFSKLPRRSKIIACVHDKNREPSLTYLNAVARKLGARVSELRVPKNN